MSRSNGNISRRDLLRLSVGLESVEDLWEDLDRALSEVEAAHRVEALVALPL